jgi:hypothetical protein
MRPDSIQRAGAPRGSGKIKENGYIQRDRLKARKRQP